jgi:hypothetical protein
VYSLGVKGYGLTTWGAMLLVLTVMLTRAYPTRPVWYHVLFVGFLTLPGVFYAQNRLKGAVPEGLTRRKS